MLNTRALAFGLLATPLFLPISATAQAAAPVPATKTAETVIIPRGTIVTVVLMAEIGSRRRKAGDAVAFKVASDILAPDGHVLLPRGTDAMGTVTKSRRADVFGRPGRIAVACEWLHPDHGVWIPVTASGKYKIERNAADNTIPAVMTAGTLGLGAAFVADFSANFHLDLFSTSPTSESHDFVPGIAAGAGTAILVGVLWRGREATLKRGTAFTVDVTEDTAVPAPPPTNPTIAPERASEMERK